MLFIPGVCALVATTRGRGSRVVAVGGALAVLGLVPDAASARSDRDLAPTSR
jgi:hypothetical protein